MTKTRYWDYAMVNIRNAFRQIGNNRSHCFVRDAMHSPSRAREGPIAERDRWSVPSQCCGEGGRYQAAFAAAPWCAPGRHRNRPWSTSPPLLQTSARLLQTSALLKCTKSETSDFAGLAPAGRRSPLTHSGEVQPQDSRLDVIPEPDQILPLLLIARLKLEQARRAAAKDVVLGLLGEERQVPDR
jgi:hypothetical protein